jgi:hypothetical protein
MALNPYVAETARTTAEKQLEWEPAPPPHRGKVVLVMAITASIVLYVLACALGGSYGSALFAIPVFTGFVCGALARSKPYLWAVAALGLSLLIAIVTLREGVVCIMFALPILGPQLALGTWLGSVLQRHARTQRTFRGFFWLMLALGAGWQVVDEELDDPVHHPQHLAQTEIEVDAPPTAVFAALTAPRLEVPNRWPWFITIGLPMPQACVLEAPGPHGRFRLEFSQGTAFAHITRWREGSEVAFNVDRYEITDLPFHITRLGRGPSYGLRSERVQDWLTLGELSYRLEPTAHGGTRLIRRTTWRRHLFPSLYFGWLQQTVMNRAQNRLLELIKQRVEADARASAQPLALRGR